VRLLKIYILVFLGTFPALSQGFLEFEKQEFKTLASGESYIIPNEEYPQHARKILSKAPSGLYVSVGTERGFIGVSQAKGASHLLLLDNNSDVVNFNKINIELLKLSETREDYLQLRHAENRQVWLDRLKKNSLHSGKENILLSQEETWKSWKSKLGSKGWAQFHRRPGKGLTQFTKFKKANYLYSDRLFSKIQRLAKNDRVQAEHFDFSSEDSVRSLVVGIKKSGLPLSVVDMSNAVDNMYIKKSQVQFIIEEFNKVAEPKSIFLSTVMAGIPLNVLKLALYRTVTPWHFLGVTFEHIRGLKSLDAFVTWYTQNPNLYRTGGINKLFDGPYRPTFCERILGGRSVR
jgi:hypothetical protein